jgi:hypothetical protein
MAVEPEEGEEEKEGEEEGEDPKIETETSTGTQMHGRREHGRRLSAMWETHHRYSDFEKLHLDLKEWLSTVDCSVRGKRLKPLPPKIELSIMGSWFSQRCLGDSFLKCRAAKLQDWLAWLVAQDELVRAPCTDAFLGRLSE